MRVIEDQPVRFGDLAGPILDGSVFFDWEITATQELARTVDYSFEELVASGRVPYAPVAVSTTVERYPTFEDTVTIDAVPERVGDSSVTVRYELEDGFGERLATARMSHVTVDADGSPLALPDRVRSRLREARVDDQPPVGPDESNGDEGLPAFTSSVRIARPYLEAVEWAYFEEYPRFADIALEDFLRERGTSLGELRGAIQPFRIRDWHWEFHSPVEFESTLEVQCDVRAVGADAVQVAHTMVCNGEVAIEGTTEYGCFDRVGEPVPFEERALAPLRS